MYAIRKTVQEGSLMPLLELLIFARGFKATDAKDKVYALLGIASDADLLQIKPDYTVELETAYRTMAASMAARKPRLDILNIPRLTPPISRLELHQHEFNLPSWVPDWSIGDSTREILPFIPLLEDMQDSIGTTGIGYPHHNADGSSGAATHDPFSNEEMLGVSGFSLGSIVAVGPEHTFVQDENRYFDPLIDAHA